MHERILVPLDGSGAAETALPYAVEIAAKLGSEILLASVSESKAGDIDHLYDSYLRHVKETVESLLRDYGAGAVSRVYDDVLLGEPADEILRHADESSVDLVVMASRGSSGRGPWLLGNIAAKVLRATSRPVLLVRSAADATALSQRSVVRKILMPLDGSDVGEAAIPCTEALARGLGAELVLLRVFQPIVPIWASGGGIAHDELVTVETTGASDAAEAAAAAYLDGLGTSFSRRGLITSGKVVMGSPADQIIDYANANSVDVIAMSTHGRSGIGRWVFGSVTDKVLHAGDTPVLVVRAAKT